MHRAGAGLYQSGCGQQGAWPVREGQGDTPSCALAAPGEHRALGPQSQRSQMGQGKLSVRPRRRTWLGIAHMEGVNQVPGHPEMGW